MKKYTQFCPKCGDENEFLIEKQREINWSNVGTIVLLIILLSVFLGMIFLVFSALSYDWLSARNLI